MLPIRLGVVRENDVAGLETFVTEQQKAFLDRRIEIGTEHRNAVRRLGDRVAVGVKETDREILDFGCDRAVGRAYEIVGHLDNNRDERIAHDLESNGIDQRARGAGGRRVAARRDLVHVSRPFT